MARILVVEDDPDVGYVVQHGLMAGGHQVELATGAAEARKLLDGGRHDLVVTDVRLPDGNGIDIADQAKAMGIRVIVVTGHAAQHHDGLRRHDYLLKPVRIGELLRAIEARLGRA